MTLYDLTSDYKNMVQLYEDSDDERYLEMLFTIEDDIATKADAYAKVMKNAKATAAALDAEIELLERKKKRQDALVDRLKQAIMQAMYATGAQRIETTIGKWSIQKNPLSVVVEHQEQIPQEFMRIPPPVVDKKRILEHYKETGEIVPGVEMKQTDGVRFR